MDLVASTKRMVVIIDHVAKDSAPKIIDRCTFPLTGVGVVDRTITDRAVFDVSPDGPDLVELGVRRAGGVRPQRTCRSDRGRDGCTFSSRKLTRRGDLTDQMIGARHWTSRRDSVE